jgi:hypothetical protein
VRLSLACEDVSPEEKEHPPLEATCTFSKSRHFRYLALLELQILQEFPQSHHVNIGIYENRPRQLTLFQSQETYHSTIIICGVKRVTQFLYRET